MSVHPTKIQISLGIRPVWSESLLYAQCVAKDASFLHADSEDSDQTGQMPRLIWVSAGCTLILLVLSCRGSLISYCLSYRITVQMFFTMHVMIHVTIHEVSLLNQFISTEKKLYLKMKLQALWWNINEVLALKWLLQSISMLGYNSQTTLLLTACVYLNKIYHLHMLNKVQCILLHIRETSPCKNDPSFPVLSKKQEWWGIVQIIITCEPGHEKTCFSHMSQVMRKPVLAICKQQRCRSACASAQYDQHFCCSLPVSYNTSTCYSQNFKTQASLISWAGRFESHLVANPEDRFSHDVAYVYS